MFAVNSDSPLWVISTFFRAAGFISWGRTVSDPTTVFIIQGLSMWSSWRHTVPIGAVIPFITLTVSVFHREPTWPPSPPYWIYNPLHCVTFVCTPALYSSKSSPAAGQLTTSSNMMTQDYCCLNRSFHNKIEYAVLSVVRTPAQTKGNQCVPLPAAKMSAVKKGQVLPKHWY